MEESRGVSRRREILCGFSARVDSRLDARCSQVKGRNFRRLQADVQMQCQWFYGSYGEYELVSYPNVKYLSPNELKCQPSKAAVNCVGDCPVGRNIKMEVAMTLLTYTVSHRTVTAEKRMELRNYEETPPGQYQPTIYPSLDFDYDPVNLGGRPRCPHVGGCTLGLRGSNLWNPGLEAGLDNLYVAIGDSIMMARHWYAYPFGSFRLYGTVKVPPVPHRPPLQKTSFVRISRNLQDFTPLFGSIESSNFAVTYRKISAGEFYRPEFQNGTTVQCPRGHYCEGALGTNFSEWLAPPFEPMPCRSGTYQNFTARGDCRVCPEGTTCPETGMPEPTLCALGYICWGQNEWDANMPMCPAGVLCLRPPHGKTNLAPSTTARIRRLLIATETGDPRYLEKLLDLVWSGIFLVDVEVGAPPRPVGVEGGPRSS